MTSRLIILKYTKTRCHSIVYLKLSLNEFASTFLYALMKPISPSIVFHGHVREAKYFVFPGFIKHLKLPSWKRHVNLCMNQSSTAHPYLFFFHKTAYLD